MNRLHLAVIALSATLSVPAFAVDAETGKLYGRDAGALHKDAGALADHA